MPPRRWALERGVLYNLDLNGEIPAVSARLPVVFGEIQGEDANPLAVAMGMPDAAAIPTRLATRRRCFAAWTGERIVGYGWVSQEHECIGEQEREIRLGPREAYIWDCVTLPACRGRGVYAALLRHMVAVLQREGIRRVWIGTSQNNRPSLKGFAKIGFRPVVTLLYLRFFSLRCLCAIGDATAPASLVDAARRALMTERERAAGPLLFTWSLAAAAPPCAEREPNPRTI